MSPGQRPKMDPSRLGHDEQAVVIGTLGACSGWIADASFDMLFGARSERLREQLLAALPSLSATRRHNAVLLASCAANRPVHAAEELLNHADPATRSCAVRFLSLLSQPDAQAQTLLADSRTDDDLTIRLASRQRQHATDPPASAWSCRHCASYNDLTDTDCRHCDQGTRPATPDE